MKLGPAFPGEMQKRGMERKEWMIEQKVAITHPLRSRIREPFSTLYSFEEAKNFPLLERKSLENFWTDRSARGFEARNFCSIEFHSSLLSTFRLFPRGSHMMSSPSSRVPFFRGWTCARFSLGGGGEHECEICSVTFFYPRPCIVYLK